MADAKKLRLIAFWILTTLVVLSQLVSGVLDLAGFEPITKSVTALGYPAYVLYILGPCKILGAITLAAPGFPRLKEWAYAGFVFDFVGAFASHALHGDGPGLLIPPLIPLSLLIGSYVLRPADRRLPVPEAAESA